MDGMRTVRLIRRAAIYVLLLAALLFSQAAAQLHALSHAGYDLAKIENGGKNPPPPHAIEKCLALLAIGSPIPGSASAFAPQPLDSRPVVQLHLSLPLPPRIVFDSRAPPAHS